MEGPGGVQDTITKRQKTLPSAELIPQYFANDANVANLLRRLYILIRQTGLVRGDQQAVREMAQELLSDVATEALAHKERYNPDFSLSAWLYGIAGNAVKRKRDQQIKASRREVPFSLLELEQGEPENKSSLDAIPALITDGPEKSVEMEEQNAQYNASFNEIFSCLSAGDQQVVRLVLHHNFQYSKVAQDLGITQDAARQRYHRATKRLKGFIQEQGSEHNG